MMTAPMSTEPLREDDPFEVERLHAAAVGRVVAVLVRSEHYRNYHLADLEWLVFPPVFLGQCAVAHESGNPIPLPVAVALWARVSEEVDERLRKIESGPLRLLPDDWGSGDIYWLIEIVGDPGGVRSLLQELIATTFKGQVVKTRLIDDRGRSEIADLVALVENGAA